MKVRNTIEVNYTSSKSLAEAILENAGAIFFHLINEEGKGCAPNDTLEALEGR